MNAYACWLYEVFEMHRQQIFELRAAMGEPEDFAKQIYEMPEDRLLSLSGLAFEEKRAQVIARRVLAGRSRDPFAIEGRLQEKGIRFVDYDDAEFPKKLRGIPDPPYGLYVIGKLPAESIPTVAIIGARGASAYGIGVTKLFAEKLAIQGIQIVSGMARGIDGVAGQSAVDCDGDSFAVLGSGVDVCYPKENRGLYEMLLRDGGVISEMVPGTEPQSRFFPMRNRIISGLCDALLVVEARKKSGTMITVDCALEQGREVFAVPGRVCDSNSWGCNQLIRQGANIAAGPEDLLEFFYGPQEQISMDGLLGAVQIEDVSDCNTDNHAALRAGAIDNKEESHQETTNSNIRMKEKAGKSTTGSARFSQAGRRLSQLERAVYTSLDPVDARSSEMIRGTVEQMLGRGVSTQEMTRTLMVLTVRGYVRELRSGWYVTYT